MTSFRSTILSALATISALMFLTSCQTGGAGSVAGNENGSAPVNKKEAKAYKKAVTRCYKTGGSRVVKIEGVLRCY